MVGTLLPLISLLQRGHLVDLICIVDALFYYTQKCVMSSMNRWIHDSHLNVKGTVNTNGKY